MLKARMPPQNDDFGPRRDWSDVARRVGADHGSGSHLTATVQQGIARSRQVPPARGLLVGRLEGLSPVHQRRTSLRGTGLRVRPAQRNVSRHLRLDGPPTISTTRTTSRSHLAAVSRSARTPRRGQRVRRAGRWLTLDGQTFTFAQNETYCSRRGRSRPLEKVVTPNDYRGSEFAGACYSPTASGCS